MFESTVVPAHSAYAGGSVVKLIRNTAIVVAALLVVGVLIWQGVTASGNPDPTASNLSPFSAAMNAGIIVFREGLEAILVLAALTASLGRTDKNYARPIALGAGLSFLASIATWFVVVGIISSVDARELDIQAGTGLLAVVVLLVIMNWFFHKLYWTGWITHHNRRKRDLIEGTGHSESAVFKGLMLVGFTCVYREGFEVVLFLQNLRLQAGSHPVLEGALIGLFLTALVAVLTFVAHYRLPYKKMLVFTGVMLGAVLVVMVGESVQEMQQAGWISTTTLGIDMPGWLDLWFAIYPSVESLASQALAALFVVGSYVVARRVRPRRRAAGTKNHSTPDASRGELPAEQSA